MGEGGKLVQLLQAHIQAGSSLRAHQHQPPACVDLHPGLLSKASLLVTQKPDCSFYTCFAFDSFIVAKSQATLSAFCPVGGDQPLVPPSRLSLEKQSQPPKMNSFVPERGLSRQLPRGYCSVLPRRRDCLSTHPQRSLIAALLSPGLVCLCFLPTSSLAPEGLIGLSSSLGAPGWHCNSSSALSAINPLLLWFWGFLTLRIPPLHTHTAHLENSSGSFSQHCLIEFPPFPKPDSPSTSDSDQPSRAMSAMPCSFPSSWGKGLEA